MNQIERSNRRQAKYNAQQKFINEVQSTQDKFRKAHLLFTKLLIENLKLGKDFLHNYIIGYYKDEVNRSGFWNKFLNGNTHDPVLVDNKLGQIINDYKQSILDDYINAVFWSIKTPAVKSLDDIEFTLNDRTLIFNQELLDIDQSIDYKDITYTSKSVKYIPFKKGEKKLVFMQYYNQIALAVINLLFQADTENIFDEIVYNGWIDAKDKRTGEPKQTYVVSLTTSKNEFQKLNLEHVDPIECVKFLHGRVEQDLESVDIEGVKPFLTFDMDKKIIEAESIIDDIKSNNLMDLTWEEFEVYVRDWLKKEFVSAKVEVTQSSRDGGIDAIIYDDDFLKGGITVVQVKQYNITVPVSAVRDLYGVMQDRRASKGILVTTSDFGPDSRQFVKDKPISLVNGTNLLYYLKKHGNNVEIKRKA